MFDFWGFGVDAHQVMTTRIFRMMTGDLSLGEATRMIIEKQTAYSNAQLAGVRGLLVGGPVEAGREMIEVYRRAVSANCARLSNAR
jgi:hypothetical protein